jgi:putative membrane protein
MSGFLNVGLYFLITLVFVVVTVFIFSLLVRIRYNVWREIEKGNMAVSLSTGGIVLGIAVIMHSAILINNTITAVLTWGGLGTVILIATFFVFELLTLKLNVMEEISKDNRAVGFISFIFSIAMSYVIAACIV